MNSRPYHRGISYVTVVSRLYCLINILRPTTLDKTLKEWEIGGAGEGGVDVVSLNYNFRSRPSCIEVGMRDDRIWDGN